MGVYFVRVWVSSRLRGLDGYDASFSEQWKAFFERGDSERCSIVFYAHFGRMLPLVSYIVVAYCFGHCVQLPAEVQNVLEEIWINLYVCIGWFSQYFFFSGKKCTLISTSLGTLAGKKKGLGMQWIWSMVRSRGSSSGSSKWNKSLAYCVRSWGGNNSGTPLNLDCFAWRGPPGQ